MGERWQTCPAKKPTCSVLLNSEVCRFKAKTWNSKASGSPRNLSSWRRWAYWCSEAQCWSTCPSFHKAWVIYSRMPCPDIGGELRWNDHTHLMWFMIVCKMRSNLPQSDQHGQYAPFLQTDLESNEKVVDFSARTASLDFPEDARSVFRLLKSVMFPMCTVQHVNFQTLVETQDFWAQRVDFWITWTSYQQTLLTTWDGCKTIIFWIAAGSRTVIWKEWPISVSIYKNQLIPSYLLYSIAVLGLGTGVAEGDWWSSNAR